eukprot:gene712-26981_t
MLSVLLTYVPPQDTATREAAVQAGASADCPLYEGNYKVNQQLPGHCFFTYVAHVACLQDLPASSAAPSGLRGGGELDIKGGGQLHLHTIPAEGVAQWKSLGTSGKAGADAVALSALYKGRVAILNQYVSDSFGKLADRPSMMPVILNATFEPVESTQYTAPRPLSSTPSSEVQPAPELEPESKAVQVLRLEFSDHLAFMLVAVRPSVEKGWAGEALDLAARAPPFQRRVFGLQLAEFPQGQPPTVEQVCRKALGLQHGHQHKSRKPTLSHVMTLRLLGSLLSKKRGNITAGAIEQEFWRHVPGTPEEKAEVWKGIHSQVNDFLLLPTYPPVDYRTFTNGKRCRAPRGKAGVLQCKRFDVAEQFHIRLPEESGWKVLNHIDNPMKANPTFASTAVFGRLGDGRYIFLMQARRQTTGLCFPSGILESNEGESVMTAALRAAKELTEEVGSFSPSADEAARVGGEAASVLASGAGMGSVVAGSGGGGRDGGVAAAAVDAADSTRSNTAFGTTNIIVPNNDVAAPSLTMCGGDGGASGAAAGSGGGRTSEDAAHALRKWLFDTCVGANVDPFAGIGLFFKNVPWAKEFVTAQPPSQFCAMHPTLLRFDPKNELRPSDRIVAMPITVDGVPLVLSAMEEDGYDFRCDVGSTTVAEFAERFCSGIPKEFGVDSLGRSLVIIPNPDPDHFDVSNMNGLGFISYLTVTFRLSEHGAIRITRDMQNRHKPANEDSPSPLDFTPTNPDWPDMVTSYSHEDWGVCLWALNADFESKLAPTANHADVVGFAKELLKDSPTKSLYYCKDLWESFGSTTVQAIRSLGAATIYVDASIPSDD